MLFPQTVAINCPTLNRRLMMFFTQELLWESQISIHTTALLDLGNALMTWGFEANITFLRDVILLKHLQ